MRATILFVMLSLMALSLSCKSAPTRIGFKPLVLKDADIVEGDPLPSDKSKDEVEPEVKDEKDKDKNPVVIISDKPIIVPVIDSKPDVIIPVVPKPVLSVAKGLYTISANHSGKCLEMTTSDNNQVINQWACNGSNIQVFRIEPLASAGDYRITNVGSNKILEIKDGSKDDGTVLRQAEYVGGDRQTFQFKSDSGLLDAVVITAKHSGKVLEVPDMSLKSAIVIQQKTEGTGKNQRWRLNKVTAVPAAATGVRYYFVNECAHDVWVGSQPNPGFPVVAGDFKLAPAAYNQTDTNAVWDGRFWGRYDCSVVNGKFQCSSGQCAKGEKCGDSYGEPPVSIAEFKTKGYENIDFYDISLVDGSNLPMNIRPMPGTAVKDGGANSCKHLTCEKDLRSSCPQELQKKDSAGKVVGCKSACEAFHTDAYCCLGAFAKAACKPTPYSKFFNEACPDAYSFAEDLKTFTCREADYEVTFCPK